MNQPISTACAAPRQIDAAGDTVSTLSHFIFVPLILPLSKRQAFDKSDECSCLDGYNWQTIPKLLKMHPQAIVPEAHGTLLVLLTEYISAYENSHLRPIAFNMTSIRRAYVAGI